MLEPFYLPLKVWRNNEYVSEQIALLEDGYPVSLNGQTLFMQVRLYEGAAGDPLLDLRSDTPTARGSQILVNTDDDNFTIKIVQGDLEAFPTADLQVAAGKSVFEFAYDIRMDNNTSITNAAVYFYGPFSLVTGVTR